MPIFFLVGPTPTAAGSPDWDRGALLIGGRWLAVGCCQSAPTSGMLAYFLISSSP